MVGGQIQNMLNEECYDCKYFNGNQCFHPHKDECEHCSLWWRREESKIASPEMPYLCGLQDTIFALNRTFIEILILEVK